MIIAGAAMIHHAVAPVHARSQAFDDLDRGRACAREERGVLATGDCKHPGHLNRNGRLRCSEAEGAETQEELKARGGFAREDRSELLKVERMLRTFVATESD